MPVKTKEGMSKELLDWLVKCLIGIIAYLAVEVRQDVKQIMQVIPAMRAEIDFLKDRRLTDKLERFDVPAFKHEDAITYDSLTKR